MNAREALEIAAMGLSVLTLSACIATFVVHRQRPDHKAMGEAFYVLCAAFLAECVLAACYVCVFEYRRSRSGRLDLAEADPDNDIVYEQMDEPYEYPEEDFEKATVFSECFPASTVAPSSDST